MLKYVAIALLLLCFVPTILCQPSQPSRDDQRAQRKAQPSPTVSNSGQTELDKTVEAERKREAEERNRKEDTYKEAQFKQNGVIATAAVYNTIIVGAYVLVAFLTLLAVYKQAKKAGEQVTKMQLTLEAIENQGKTLRRQAIGTVSQAKSTRDALAETRKMVEKNAEVVEIMKKQLTVMSAASEAQVDFAVIEGKATERSAKAAEDGVEVTRQNMIYAQRAYVSIISGSPMTFEEGFDLTIMNSGNTPAMDVSVKYLMDVGHLPPELPVSGAGYWDNAGVIAPKGDYHIATRLNREITDEERKLLETENEEFRLWCRGVIYYYDIFQGAKATDPHCTKFCLYQDLGSPTLRAWIDGNEAD